MALLTPSGIDYKQIAYNLAIGLDPIEAVIQSGCSKSRAYITQLLSGLKQNRDFLNELAYFENLIVTGEIEKLAKTEAQDLKNQEIIQQLKSFLQGLINFDLSEHLEEMRLTDEDGNSFTALSITSLDNLKKACPYIKKIKFLREGAILEFHDKTQIADQLMKLIEVERKSRPQNIDISFSVIKEANPNRELIMDRINQAISRGIHDN